MTAGGCKTCKTCTTVLPKQFMFGSLGSQLCDLGSQLCDLDSQCSILAATKKVQPNWSTSLGVIAKLLCWAGLSKMLFGTKGVFFSSFSSFWKSWNFGISTKIYNQYVFFTENDLRPPSCLNCWSQKNTQTDTKNCHLQCPGSHKIVQIIGQIWQCPIVKISTCPCHSNCPIKRDLWNLLDKF